ncbi:MAG: response regulator transcription factor [Chloroflexi bacterium]|nr:response regulator transcription factor [Chloroflexota bacterium]
MNEPITLLIIDDHPMVRAGLRSLLTAPGIEIVDEAGSGAEAIRKITKLTPQVALMDIRMPDMDGIAVLEKIKAARLPTRVIMVTTYKNTTYLLRALAAGADGFVLKDISREDLLATVQAVAAGESRVDQAFLQSVLRSLNDSNQNQAATAPEPAEPLTPREMDVLQLLVEGLTNQAIAQVLGLSAGTVKGYVQTILRKLDAADRTQAAVRAIRVGLIK